MRWTKRGVIFAAKNDFEWMVSHASIPVVDEMNGDVLRICFGTRDKLGRSLPPYIEVEADDPKKILRIDDKPVLSLGKLGTFNDSGIMPSWIVSCNRRRYLYYIGWNRRATVPYHLAIGPAMSTNGGENYRKYSEGPVLDRAVDEPYFKTAPCVIVDGSTWKM